MKKFKELTLPDKCLVYRYLYYVKNISKISDQQYDGMEREAVESASPDHPIHSPGSDLEDSYPDYIKEIAKSFRN